MYSMAGLSFVEQVAIWAVFFVAIGSLFYAFYLRSLILQKDKGTEKMQEVWGQFEMVRMLIWLVNQKVSCHLSLF
jgi:Na+/H+-translocating membrane pyrophosphatase